MNKNALTKKINLPLWFMVASYGYLIYEAMKKPKKTGISKSDYDALNRERVAAFKNAQTFERKLFSNNLIDADDLQYD